MITGFDSTSHPGRIERWTYRYDPLAICNEPFHLGWHFLLHHSIRHFFWTHLAIFSVSKLRRPVRAIDQRVRTDFVVDVGDVDVRRRPPLQGLGYIARPDAPCGTVSEV